jgi:8-oxo-dGTP diphosphatase
MGVVCMRGVKYLVGVEYAGSTSALGAGRPSSILGTPTIIMRKPNNIELISRGVVTHGGAIFLCKHSDVANYFFPGGHVEEGENTKEALERELLEETGHKISIGEFMGVVEFNYPGKTKQIYEINFVYQVSLDSKDVSSKEEKLKFEWISLRDLDSIDVRPKHLTDAVVNWMHTKKLFHKIGSA